MLEYDAIIVGAGPVGGHVARRIAEKKFKVAIFERNKHIGTPVKCAGLITSRVFDILDIQKEKVILNKIKGANIHSPSDNILKIGGDKVHALVIDREKFDNEIIKKAKEKGAEIFLENSVLSSQKINDHIEISTLKKIDAKCNLLIGADGPCSKIRDRFILPEPKEFLRGIGAEITNVHMDPDFLEIFVGEKIAPGFFAWVIPTNDKGTTARIGLCINNEAKNPPRHYLENLMKNTSCSKLLKNAEIIKYTGGVIPIGALKRTYASNIMVVGDAAAQVKPTSGGGIYTGLSCANYCADVAIESLEKNNFDANFLKKYHKLWSSKLGRELFLGMSFRKIFKNLKDEQFDKYIKKFQDPKITEIISKYGDIDFPSKMVKPLLRKIPSLMTLLPNIIKEN